MKSREDGQLGSPGREADALDTPSSVVMDDTLPVTSISPFQATKGPALRVFLAESEGMVLAGGGVRVTHVLETEMRLPALDTARSSFH